MQYVHMAGVLHRDIKASNVLITRADNFGGMPLLKLGDFGVAKMNSAGACVYVCVCYVWCVSVAQGGVGVSWLALMLLRFCGMQLSGPAHQRPAPAAAKPACCEAVQYIKAVWKACPACES